MIMVGPDGGSQPPKRRELGQALSRFRDELRSRTGWDVATVRLVKGGGELTIHMT